MALMRMTRERLDQLRVELVGGDGHLVAEIKSLFAGLGAANVKIAEVDPAKLTEDHLHSDLSLVIFGSNEAASIGYLQAQGRHPHRPAMVAVLPAHSPAAMRRVLHAGADEVLILPLSASSLSRILARLGTEHHRMEHGSISSLVSLSGGAGVTTLSGSLALALRYAFNQRVAIVDLNLQSGGLEAFLHVEPDRAIRPVTATRAEPGASAVEAALTRHTSGVCLLAAPSRIEDSESVVDDVAVSAALDDLRQSFDVVVVDCGRHVDANVVAAWERSEEVLYVLDPSRAAARSGVRFRELFAHLGLQGIAPTMVMNKAPAENTPRQERNAIVTVGSLFARIPRAEQLLEQAQLHAQNPWQIAPDSEFVRAVEDLARGLIARRVREEGVVAAAASRPTAIGPRV